MKIFKSLRRKIQIKRNLGKKIKLLDGREEVCNIIIIKENVNTGREQLIFGANIVTASGDKYYAEKAAGQTASWSPSAMRLGYGSAAPTKNDTDVTSYPASGGWVKAIDSTYPKTSDTDADNTGSGVNVITWRVTFGTGDANGTGIRELAITNLSLNPTAALTHALFASAFDKTSSDTLKIFINHNISGV